MWVSKRYFTNSYHSKSRVTKNQADKKKYQQLWEICSCFISNDLYRSESWHASVMLNGLVCLSLGLKL